MNHPNDTIETLRELINEQDALICELIDTRNETLQMLKEASQQKETTIDHEVRMMVAAKERDQRD